MNDKLNQYRIFPRAFAIFYGIITWDVWQWIKHTPGLTEYQHYFAMAVITGAVAYFKLYVESGKK